ncbi:MAG: Slp family lipoprotein, partial [Thermomonas sp.]
MNLRPITLCIATALLAACATQPTPLQGQFQALTPHEAVIGDHTGSMVRWGGRIIRTEPRPDRTCFEVIS